MTFHKRLLALSVAAPLLTACPQKDGGAQNNAPAGQGAAPTTEDEKSVYALGQLMARNLQPFNLQPNEMGALFSGIQDSVAGKPSAVDMATYGPKVNELARARAAARSEVEKKKGQAFQAEQEKLPGAQKSPSGLIYFETQAGTGEQPTAADTVKVHYKGTLMDGTEFDSSFKRNQPAQFPLGGVIKCWTEGVAKMKVGGKAKLVCPSDIAYGDRGSPPTIPPGATLIFEVELLEIVKGGQPGLPPGHP